MAADLIDTLTKLDAEATKGPWTSNDLMGRIYADGRSLIDYMDAQDAFFPNIQDAPVVATLRSALPELIVLLRAADEVRHLGIAYGNDDPVFLAYDAARAAFAAKVGAE